jgi:hypothetical protein
MIGVVETVYIVHENKHLMRRDQEDFKVFWELLDATEAVSYQAGLDFVPKSNSLIIFDEADAFIFRDPVKFEALISGCFCICFTATPDNCDPNGVQRGVVEALHFSVFSYVLDAPTNGSLQLEAESVVDLPTDEQRVEYVRQRLSNGPVLGFFDP